jgi:hypothetical protein
MSKPTPDSLMAAINDGPALSTSLIKAAILHVIIIAVCSVPYFFQVATHGTFDVRAAIQEQQAQAAEAEKEKRREDRKKEREAQVKAATEAAAQSEAEGGPAKSATPGTRPAASPFENEVSNERPTESDIDIDDDFGL